MLIVRRRFTYAVRDADKRDLFASIETYYNRQRLHSALGRLAAEQREPRPHNPVSTLPGKDHALRPGSGCFAWNLELNLPTLCRRPHPGFAVIASQPRR